MNLVPTTAEEWRPLHFNLRESVDRQALARLKAEGKIRETFDTIVEQLRDLAAVRQPRRKLRPAELADAVSRLVGDTPPHEYGRWVYFPWAGRLVHLLERDDFREVRFNRNRNKITATEQARLEEVTVGVVGLSVGNAVARTLALEGIGTLKLADFDRLDLSNLNRMQAGVHEIGVNKAVLAARQILELDPDARVGVFPHGVTEENLDEFLSSPPRIDILVDECDSLAVKILLRERARARQTPVLMETSDRGMLDVERFDQEPDRPVFHGLVGELRAADLRTLSMEQKVVHVLQIIGGETMSARFAASLIEIERTLSTWPQLGSDVTLGGATVATAVRRLALGQPLSSGRRYVDLEQLLEANPMVLGKSASVVAGPSRTESPTRIDVTPFLRFLVEHGAMAPSGGNCQPWRFYADGDQCLHLEHDGARSHNLLDRTQLASCLALGAAVENIVIAAAQRGFATNVEPFPVAGKPSWVATLRFEPTGDAATLASARLFEAVGRRVTNRRSDDPKPLAPEMAEVLRAAAAAHGGILQLHTDRCALDETARILGEADRVRFLCADLHREVMNELRWTSHETETSRDGIDLATLELTEAEAAAMRVLARADTAAILRELNAGIALTEGAAKSIRGACALGLLRTRGEDLPSFLEAGRALQRTWLTATQLGLGLQPIGALLFMFRMLPRPEGAVFSERERRVLVALEAPLDHVFAEHGGQPRAMLFRLTRATDVTARALRRPLSSVLFKGTPP